MEGKEGMLFGGILSPQYFLLGYRPLPRDRRLWYVAYDSYSCVFALCLQCVFEKNVLIIC